MKKLLLIFALLGIFSIANAIEYSYNISDTNLPYNFTQIVDISSQNDINASIMYSDWLMGIDNLVLSAGDIYNLSVDVEVPIMPQGTYNQTVTIIKDDGNFIIDFIFNIQGKDTIEQENGDLVIITKDYLTLDVISNINIMIMFSDQILNGTTNSEGSYTFANLTEGCWKINITEEEYLNESFQECVPLGKIVTRNIYLKSLESVGNMTPDMMAGFVNASIDDMFRWLELYRSTQPTVVYENVTEYRTVPMSANAFAKLLEGCDPTIYDAVKSERDTLRTTNIDIFDNRIQPLEDGLSSCMISLNDTETACKEDLKWKVPVWIVFALICGFIGISFIIYYRYKKGGSFNVH